MSGAGLTWGNAAARAGESVDVVLARRVRLLKPGGWRVLGEGMWIEGASIEGGLARAELPPKAAGSGRTATQGGWLGPNCHPRRLARAELPPKVLVWRHRGQVPARQHRRQGASVR
ncbi:hypothetical protein ACQPW3_42240 [Actinosynnema sp. CA-248983]